MPQEEKQNKEPDSKDSWDKKVEKSQKKPH